MKENGMVDNLEIMPDLENEQIEEVITPMPETPKSGGCGCNKNKGNAPSMPMASSMNWTRILMIVGGIALVYFLFKKKGKIEVPKVEVPEV